ncbi:beta-N-acetylhexosaminidase [Pseudopedobacter beijingensis]|uniref:beta-N-acetylhexosaminidase n=1 Tax=Pseudopedobacter beijingensis TaxID=1207056 RepID=A0ABW4IDU0_9SPHI
MKKISVLIWLLLTSLTQLTAQNNTSLGIIPAPVKVIIGDGSYPLSSKIGVEFVGFNNTNSLAKFVGQLSFIDLQQRPGLKLILDKSLAIKEEGYLLSVKKDEISIRSTTERGVFYGLQSLLQIVNTNQSNIPFLEIEDYPRFAYRGMHLDVARHLFPVSFIKEYIDMLAYYKLNTFHWHLTEDQGWRIEIKKYPKLTTIGGFRDQTLIGYLRNNPKQYDNERYGGFYTQEEVKEVVAYAASKYITVVPEIEMPGHALAALSAYPELACGKNPTSFKAAYEWGVFDDVFCAGKEQTFKFLQDVLDEVLPLFPSEYIHIGGDECPKTKWKTCEFCQKRIQKEKLKDEHELQSYFIQRMEKYLNKKGRQIIGWDEILEGGLAPNATVMSWRGTKGGIAAAKLSHKVIMTPGPYLYFDKQESQSSEEPLTIGGHVPLSKVYAYNPVPDELTDDEKKYIIGVQANVWTEYLKTPEKVRYMVYPRIFALSEIAWTPLENKNWEEFSENRVATHLGNLDKKGAVYRVPEPIGAKDTTLLGENFELKYKIPVKGAAIYYTINGRIPYDFDSKYRDVIRVHVPKGEERILKSVVITSSGRRSVVMTTILKN